MWPTSLYKILVLPNIIYEKFKGEAENRYTSLPLFFIIIIYIFFAEVRYHYLKISLKAKVPRTF